LLRLEPVPGRDPTGARDDLLAVARGGERTWAGRARHALAWLNEQHGDLSRAQEGYSRVIVDFPGEPAAARASAGLGRLRLLGGSSGEAAALLDRAVRDGFADAAVTREAAVRRLRQPALPLDRTPLAVTLPVRDVSAIGPAREGLYVADRRAGTVLRVSDTGTTAESWGWSAPVEALTVDSRGRAFAAAAGSIWRLAPAGRTVEVGRLGQFGPIGSIATGGGAVWVADRRGQRLGRLEAGAEEPALIAEDRASRLEALAWDGRRLLGLDGRTGFVRVWGAAGGGSAAPSLPPFGGDRLRPALLSVDPSGRLLLADPRSNRVRLLESDGTLLDEADASALGVERLGAAAFGPDGALHLVDARTSSWVIVR
jgi:hypothetical protein